MGRHPQRRKFHPTFYTCAPARAGDPSEAVMTERSMLFCTPRVPGGPSGSKPWSCCASRGPTLQPPAALHSPSPTGSLAHQAVWGPLTRGEVVTVPEGFSLSAASPRPCAGPPRSRPRLPAQPPLHVPAWFPTQLVHPSWCQEQARLLTPSFAVLLEKGETNGIKGLRALWHIVQTFKVTLKQGSINTFSRA